MIEKLMMKNNIKYIYLHMVYFIYSFVNLTSKITSNYNISSKEFYYLLAFLIFFMGIYAVLWQQVIKLFPLSVAYSNRGVVILWTFIWASIFLNESITLSNLIGAFLIILGIYLVNKNA